MNNTIWNRKNHEHFERVKNLNHTILAAILTVKQYKYYVQQKEEHKTILQIAEENHVAPSTVAHTLSRAKSKVLKYYENQMKG